MNIDKTEILSRICYTEFVYERINKKLDSKFSKSEIEKMLFDIVRETQEMFFQKIGKNIYIYYYMSENELITKMWQLTP